MKSSNDSSVATQLKSTWTKIYQDWFGREVDFTELTIPSFYDSAKHFAVIVAQCTAMNEVFTAMNNKFNLYSYTGNLDSSVITNDRIADKDYVIIFNKNIKADDNLKNLSANKLIEMNISGITLLERLLLEVLYFDNTSGHLDINDITLCSGSRDSGGNAPVVFWDDDSRLHVSWYYVDSCYDHLRSRAVVTQ